MKNTWNKAWCVLLSSSLLLASCDKEDTGELEGPVPQGTFTTTSRTVGLATEVTFTATAPDAFLYQWEFGDGSTGTGQTVTHTYKSGGTFKAQLITAGRGGTGFSQTADVVVASPLTIIQQLLTGTGSKTWMLDNTVDAPIIVGTEGNPGEYFPGVKAGELPACQTDDEYTFSNTNVFTYDAKAQTYVAGGVGCAAPRSSTSEFTYGPSVGAGFAMLEFKNTGTFIGVTDAPDLTYRIIDITERTMTIRAGKSTSGVVFEMKLVAKP